MSFDKLENKYENTRKKISSSNPYCSSSYFCWHNAICCYLGIFYVFGREYIQLFFQKTNLFWVRLLWFEGIIAVFWYSFTGNYLKKILSERKQTGAINIIIGSAFFKLAIYSTIIWLIGCFLPTSPSWQGWIWLILFVIIIFYVFLLYFLPHMRILQTDGIGSLPSGIKTPDELANALLILESSVDTSEKEKKVIKRIREKIKYSIPRAGMISQSENYKFLVNEVENFSALSSKDRAIGITFFEDNVMKKILTIQNECKN